MDMDNKKELKSLSQRQKQRIIHMIQEELKIQGEFNESFTVAYKASLKEVAQILESIKAQSHMKNEIEDVEQLEEELDGVPDHVEYII